MLQSSEPRVCPNSDVHQSCSWRNTEGESQYKFVLCHCRDCKFLNIRPCYSAVGVNLLMLQVVGARDQRVTALVVSVLLGASVLMAPILKLVPFAVLFGVFLYMGISGTS